MRQRGRVNHSENDKQPDPRPPLHAFVRPRLFYSPHCPYCLELPPIYTYGIFMLRETSVPKNFTSIALTSST